MIDCPDEIVSEEIGNLRTHVRKEHKDIRANGNVILTLWKFIEVAQRRAPRTGPTDTTAAKKRRRGDNNDDEEYRPTPITNLGVMPGLRVRPGK